MQVRRGEPSCERIDPAQAGKSQEVGIGAVEFALMLDSQRGELGIGGHIPGSTESHQMLEKKLLELGTRMENADRFLTQP